MTTKQDLIDAQLEAARIIKAKESRRSVITLLVLVAFGVAIFLLRSCISTDPTGDMLEENRRKTANVVTPN